MYTLRKMEHGGGNKMIVETRKTASGTEYWDNKEKKVLFVPAGKEPSFEVTDNPKSMLLGVDLAIGKDKTIINGNPVDPDDEVNIKDMTVKQLRAYAAELEIEIPSDVTKKDDIIALLSDGE